MPRKKPQPSIKPSDLGFLGTDNPFGPSTSSRQPRGGGRGARGSRASASGRGRGRGKTNKLSFAETLALTMDYLSQSSSLDDSDDDDDWFPAVDLGVAAVLTQTQQGPDDVLLGTLRGQIVGIQYYKGMVSNGEMVTLVREPKNPYDKNAVKVENVWGVQVGHIKRQLAEALSYIVDNNYARIDGVVPYGNSNVYSMPIDISLWGPEGNQSVVSQKLRGMGFVLRHERAPSMGMQLSTSSGKGRKTAIYNPRSALGKSVVLSEAEMKNEVDTLFDNLKSLDKTTEQEPSKFITSKMYPHQKQALNWMLARERDDKLPPFWEETPMGFYRNSLTNFASGKRPNCVRGGILADEMGLGKTLSVIALILHEFFVPETLVAVETPPLLPSLEVELVEDKPECSQRKKAGREDKKSLQLKPVESDIPVVADEVIVIQDSEEIPAVGHEEIVVIDDDSQDKWSNDECTTAGINGNSKAECSSAVINGCNNAGCSEANIGIKTETGCSTSSRPKRAAAGNVKFVFSDGSDEFPSPEKKAKMKKPLKAPKVPKVKGQSSKGKGGKTRPQPAMSPLPGGSKNPHVDPHQPSLQPSTSQLPPLPRPAPSGSGTASQAKVKPRSGEGDSGMPRSTLIICPLSVLSNWIDQLGDHVDEEAQVSVVLYYGAERKKMNADHLARQDVVITTYSTMAAEYKANKEKSTLHTVEWQRIVLDEAHTIRNPGTLQTRAAHALKARCRWALTGTPIQNSIRDLWSLVAFLGLEPFKSTHTWWQRIIARPIANNNSVGIERVRKLMDTLALRRMKAQKVNGKPLVDLPARNVVLQYVDFSKDEKEVYKTMERDGRLAVSKYFQQGTVLDHYGDILAILMRLRQLCCHPGLCAKAASMICQAAAGDSEKTDEERAELVATLVSFLSQGADEECCICLESIEDPVITRCAHVFCQNCIGEVITKDGEAARCPLCRRPVSNDTLVHVPKENVNKENDDPGEWHSSAKVDALMECMLKQRAADKSVRSIVVSQFTSFLDIIQKPLAEKGFKFTRLDGSMSRNARTTAIRQFSSTNPDSPTVFLLSLKAGGVGLNLTAASRLYLLDPAWNPACEEQCFDRCHRLGQTRDVIVTKFIVRDSVEESMLELQDRKRQLMKKVFDGKKQTAEERRANRVRDIKILMGMNKTGAN